MIAQHRGNTLSQNHKCKRVRYGKYLYRGYELVGQGYYPPDHQVWWEGVDPKTGCADFHAETKGLLKYMIDKELDDVTE